jgi:hypothetical protein
VDTLHQDVMFEPWSMGDAIIAAAVAREDPERFALLCDNRWVELIRMGLPTDSALQIRGVHLPYTVREAKNKYSLPSGLTIPDDISGVKTVFNIRGDVRDRRASRRLFPNAKIRQSGWFGFLARRSAAIDLLVEYGLVKVRNRYKAWCDLTGVPFDSVVGRYEMKSSPLWTKVVIHIGAQWRSKRYPHVLDLEHELRKHGIETAIIRGPGDPLPFDLSMDLCPEMSGAELIECLRSASVVVTNDSGPMHLAAYLGCNVICIGSVSNLAEWIPPGVCAITSSDIPKGYRPLPNYMSDHAVSSWPPPSAVVEQVMLIVRNRRSISAPA